MPVASIQDGAEFLSFDKDALLTLAEEKAPEYANAKPFHFVVIDNFLPSSIAGRLAEKFPSPGDPIWPPMGEAAHQQNKLGIRDASRLKYADPLFLSTLWALNSHPFCVFLERLTGIPAIVPDPHYRGGGLHQILRGGLLKVHADFNYLPELNLYRKLNVLLYLNPNWQSQWGGDLELWDETMSHCVHKIAPVLNRCVIFRTSSKSYHGHPDPLKVPEAITRKSLALYYYTSAPSHDDDVHHSTLFQQRPGTNDPASKERV